MRGSADVNGHAPVCATSGLLSRNYGMENDKPHKCLGYVLRNPFNDKVQEAAFLPVGLVIIRLTSERKPPMDSRSCSKRVKCLLTAIEV